MEARTLRCQGCGASVPPDAPQCPYCRAQLATVACPACLAMAPLTASHCPACGSALPDRAGATPGALACPACGGGLSEGKVGELDLRDCRACGGLWLDRAAFERLGASREAQGAVLGALPLPSAPSVAALGPVVYRPCPICAQRMNRVNYAKRSGVVLDVCKAHGLWFDQDELRRVLAFIAGGGLERTRQRELEELKEARRAAVERPGHPASSYEFDRQFTLGGSGFAASVLVDLVLGAAGLFLDGS